MSADSKSDAEKKSPSVTGLKSGKKLNCRTWVISLMEGEKYIGNIFPSIAVLISIKFVSCFELFLKVIEYSTRSRSF